MSDEQKEEAQINNYTGGPKTVEGKAISRLNATQHGLTGKVVNMFTNTDSLKDFMTKLNSNPCYSGPIVDILAERVSENYAKIKKADEAVKELLSGELEIMDLELMERINRYYITIENRLYKSVREYKEFIMDGWFGK